LEGNEELPTQCLVCPALDFMARAIYGTPTGGVDARGGSKPGERRGGRAKGTPNKTILVRVDRAAAEVAALKPRWQNLHARQGPPRRNRN
jgi:hypothetical protein